MPFRHNAAHDAESVLWLALYLILTCYIVYPEDMLPDVRRSQDKARRELGDKLFRNRGLMMSDVLFLLKRIGADLVGSRVRAVLQQPVRIVSAHYW